MSPLHERLWSQPLTANEREIIHGILGRADGDGARKWLVHVLRIHDALLAQLERAEGLARHHVEGSV